jgi:hypothetical protein
VRTEVVSSSQAGRSAGDELTVQADGPVTWVEAVLHTNTVGDPAVSLHHGMTGRAEVTLDRVPTVLALLPGGRR